MVQPWRMQVTTSCRMRRPGAWNSTSLVTTVRDARRGRPWPRAACSRSWSRGRRRRVRARCARSPKMSASRRSRAAQVASGSSGTSTAIRPSAWTGDVLPAEQALRLAAAPLAERQQAAEPAIGGPVGRVDQERGAVGQVEPAADDQPHARRLRRLVRADDAGEAVAVGDRQGLDAEHGRLGEQLLARAGAAQEREMRRALELGVAHPNTPCRNQRCEPVPASSPSPSRNSQKRSPASVSTWK